MATSGGVLEDRESRIALIGAWSMVVIVTMLGIFASHIFEFGNPPDGWRALVFPIAVLVLFGAIITWYFSVGRLVSARRWAAMAAVGLAMVPGLFLVATFSTPPAWDLHGTVRFWALRPAYDQAADLARSDLLDPAMPQLEEVELPKHLCVTGPRCSVTHIGQNGGEPVVFIYYIEDSNPAGYGHFVDAPDFDRVYGEWVDSWVCPVRHLGDGWWWMEYTWPNDCRGDPLDRPAH